MSNAEQIVRLYTLDMLRELFTDEEYRKTGKPPPALSSIASTEDDDGLGVIVVTFGGDTDG